MDVPKERARLEKEYAQLEQEQTTCRIRLENPDFVSRAKPEVVEATKTRVQDISVKLEELLKQRKLIETIA